jgi:hypothetical protein
LFAHFSKTWNLELDWQHILEILMIHYDFLGLKILTHIGQPQWLTLIHKLYITYHEPLNRFSLARVTREAQE